MLLSTTLRLFLDGIGRREEYEFYLRKFQTGPGACFAALMPDAVAMEESEEAIAFDLHFLLRLELTPMVLLCGPEAQAMRSSLVRALPASLVVEAAADPEWAGTVEGHLAVARRQEKVLAVCSESIPAATVLRALIPAVVRRLHLVRARGPLRDVRDRPVSLHLLQGRNDHALADGEQATVDLAAACLAAAPGMHVSVASPLDLLAELFTVRGKGTVIRRGSVIRHAGGIAGLDLDRLTALLVEAFGRPLARPETLGDASEVYLEENYRGAALLEAHPAGLYLAKFAVGTQARGDGLAQELWNEMIDGHPSLFWRSRPGNPINGWYERQADGRLREEPWHIFWRGIRAEDIPAVVAYCRSRPADFVAAKD